VTRFPTQTALTIASLGALFAFLPRVAPAIKGPRLSQLAALAEFDPARTPLTPLTLHRTEEIVVEPPFRSMARSIAKPIAPLLDDANGGLDHFYAALWRTERKEAGAVTRVTHYGDSPTTADLITGDIRAQLQAQFGDAGHGFILLAKPWAWYQHRGVSLSGAGWQIVPATHAEIKDGFFGLGGVTFTAGAVARTHIHLDDPGQSRFELYYLQQPGGGSVTVTAQETVQDTTHATARATAPDTTRDTAPDTTVTEIPTAGDAKSPGFAPFTVAGGAADLELRTEGRVRLFGLTAEKPGPGVVYDSLGLNGASITVLSHTFNQQHWAAELRRRNPDMVVINYGTNEADFAEFVDKYYEKELREAIRRVRAALPAASILVMSPMDRGHLTGPGEIETMATIPLIVATQRRVAQDTGCGFFDTFTAMGGPGTMARWYASQPRLVSADFIHPYPAGGKIVATIFVKQIESGLSRYKLRQVQSQSPASGAVR
jgi:lysophospholipase L1-like esterase